LLSLILLAEVKAWQLGPVELPKSWAFWETGKKSKAEIAAAGTDLAVQEKVVNDSERDNIEMELFFKEHSVDAKTPRGHLSPAAINTIEQFSRYIYIYMCVFFSWNNTLSSLSFSLLHINTCNWPVERQLCLILLFCGLLPFAQGLGLSERKSRLNSYRNPEVFVD
jgi:hypothetical protein